MNGHDVIRVARTWKGTPFLHQGRTRVGIDCGGLVIVVAQELGLDALCGYVDRRDYPRLPTDDSMMRLLRQYMDRVPVSDMRAGDVLHFSFALMPHHAAFYTGADNRMIHAYNGGTRTVIETGYTGKWPGRLHSVYRYRGLM